MDPNQPIRPMARPHPDLLAYLQTQTSQGWTIDQVVTSAKIGGWSDEQIETCLAWMSNNYAANQMSINQTYASDARYTQVAPKQIMSRLIAVIVFLIVLALVGVGAYLLASNRGGSDEALFQETIKNSLRTGSYRQVQGLLSAEESFIVNANAKTDFREPANPRSEMSLNFTFDFDKTEGGFEGSISVDYDSIAMSDAAWIRPTKIVFDLNEETRTVFEELAPEGETAEDALTSLLGIGEVNTWTKYLSSDVDQQSDFLSFNESLVSACFSLNTVLSEFMIANTGESANEIADIIKRSGMYDVRYDNTKKEIIGSKEYVVFDVGFNPSAYIQASKDIAQVLGISGRQTDTLDEHYYDNKDASFSLWVDPDTKLPYKLSSPGLGIAITYSEYGSNYEIRPPQ